MGWAGMTMPVPPVGALQRPDMITHLRWAQYALIWQVALRRLRAMPMRMIVPVVMAMTVAMAVALTVVATVGTAAGVATAATRRHGGASPPPLTPAKGNGGGAIRPREQVRSGASRSNWWMSPLAFSSKRITSSKELLILVRALCLDWRPFLTVARKRERNSKGN